MPGISRIILAKRMHDDSDRLSYPGFDGKRISEEERILIAIPALVFEMEVKELTDDTNIFVSTVTQLAKIKRLEIQDNGVLYDYISEKTGLSRMLVKSILTEEELNRDIQNGTENKVPQRSIKRIVYNPVSGSFYPYSISSDTYDRYTRAASVHVSADETELQFRLQEAQRWNGALILHTDPYDEDNTLRNPVFLMDKVPGLRQRLFRSNVSGNDIYYTGQCQKVSALCYCYLSDNDLSTLHLSSPVGHGDSDVMLPAILEMMRKYPSANEELINQIESLENSRKDKLDSAGDWDQQLAEQEKEICIIYPKLAGYSSVLNRVTTLTQTMHTDEQNSLIVAFHEFLEEIMLQSCRKYVPSGTQWDEYNERINRITGDGDKADLLVGFAEEVGFISNDEERQIALKCFALRKTKEEKKEERQRTFSDYEAKTSVAGVTFSNSGDNTENRQDIIRSLVSGGLLDKGQSLDLVPEPDNPKDPNAIRVIGPDGRQIGNIPKEIAVILSSRIRNGENYHAVVLKVKGGNGFNYGVDIHIKGYDPYATQAGKIGSQAAFIRRDQLKALLDGKWKNGYHLSELLAANIIQAVVNPKHPFRILATKCHDLVSTIYYSITSRGDAKHDNDDKRNSVVVTRDVMTRTMDSLLLHVLGVQKLSGEALDRERIIRAGRQKAIMEAEKQMSLYPILSGFKDGDPLKKVCTSFFERRGDYFSVCSNLLDKLLSEVLSEQTLLEQRRNVAMSFFSGDRFPDAEKMSDMFREIGCRYQTNDCPDTGKIKSSWNSKFLSLKNKLFLCVATLYRYNREYLDKIVQSVPEIAEITDIVCIERGHNNVTNFSASGDGYQEFHNRLLKCCENLYQLCLGTNTLGGQGK